MIKQKIEKIEHIKNNLYLLIKDYKTNIEITDDILIRIYNIIYSNKFSFKRKFLRLGLNLLLKFLPLNIQIKFLNILKKKNKKYKPYIEIKDYFIYNIDFFRSNKITYPGKKRYFTGISFDIDNKIDYDKLYKIIEDLIKYKIKATINFLIHSDYNIDLNYLKYLEKNNFEIGLHGDTHNTALAFLPENIIKYKLRKSLEKIERRIFGFRAPGFSFSETLIKVLAELEFLYDSSLTNALANYNSIKYPYVFKYKNYNIYEIPVLLQDYNFFTEKNYKEKEVFEIFKKLINQTKEINGIVLLNFHPMLCNTKRNFWNNILEIISKDNEMYNDTLVNLAGYYNER